MNKRRAISLFFAFLLAGLAAAYAGWRITHEPSKACDVCRRPLHARSRAVALVDGHRESFCCPACARTAHRQTGRDVRILALTDYETDARVAPEQAWIVVGGEGGHCDRHAAMLVQDMHPAAEQFDRCSPAVVAFARKEAARSFAARSGGAVMRFSELK